MSELTPEIRAKRVAVAKDVIERIAIGKMRVIRMDYFRISPTIRGRVAEFVERKADLQECVDEIEAGCRVCAKGAMFLSMARLYNDVPMSKVAGSNGYAIVSESGICETLDDIFDWVTLDRIEVAFECRAGHGNLGDSGEMIRAAKKFGLRHGASPARCKAVMENIVANDGEFLP